MYTTPDGPEPVSLERSKRKLKIKTLKQSLAVENNAIRLMMI